MHEVVDHKPTRAEPPEAPGLASELTRLLAESIDNTALTEQDRERLLQHRSELAAAFQSLLCRFAAAERLQAQVCPAFELDVTTPVAELVLACGGDEQQALNASLFTDPAIWPTSHYRLVDFPEDVRVPSVLAQLSRLNWRGATLRETLCLLRSAPDALPLPVHLVVLGSSHLRRPEAHPCVILQKQGRAVTTVTRHQTLRPKMHRLLVAKRPDPQLF